MTYTLAGLIFTFALDGSGNVVSITTPNINVGPFMLFPSTVLNFDPTLTVVGAEAVVSGLLQMLGLL